MSSALFLGSKAILFKGQLSFTNSKGEHAELWLCEHQHTSHDAAELCAEVQLEHMLVMSTPDGTTDLRAPVTRARV